MLTSKQEAIKEEIMKNLGVVPTEEFDVKTAVRDRVEYLKRFLKSTGRKSIVLGISGGIDSFTAGKLSQIAMTELREEGYNAEFIAVRLPYKIQKDEVEAQMSIDYIGADKVVDINIGTGVDGIFDSILTGLYDSELKQEEQICTNDFAKGNVKARMRMISQYAIAGMHNGLVLGTDHNSENITGFYTLHGDGACDFLVLNGLNKRQVRLVAKELGAPEWLYAKKATADLEDDSPQLLDEDSLGISYDKIDDFLEGKELTVEEQKLLIDRYAATEFKRRMPMEFHNVKLGRVSE